MILPNSLDPRRHAFRPDLADEALRGRVEAASYVTPTPHQVIEASAPLRGWPDLAAGWTTEALFGELVNVFDVREGWAWIQLMADGYVGYVQAAALSPSVEPCTHAVSALATWLYPAPDMKAPPVLTLSMAARLTVRDETGSFLRLADGRFVPSQHIAPVSRPATDFVDAAQAFVGTPYQWGGKTRLGLDCSGLVQVALAAAGKAAPRDSDMQARELGEQIDPGADFAATQRGDLVFWKGHVGIVAGTGTLLHANAFHMAVVEEPLHAAIARIAATGSSVTAVRRLKP